MNKGLWVIYTDFNKYMKSKKKSILRKLNKSQS